MNARRTRLGGGPVETAFALVVVAATLVSILHGAGVLDPFSTQWERSELASAGVALALCCFGTHRVAALVVAALAMCAFLLTSGFHGPDTQGPGFDWLAALVNLVTLVACVPLLLSPGGTARAPSGSPRRP